MALVDRVIAAFDKLIIELPDKPNASAGLTSEQLKGWWDSSPEELRLAINGVVSDLIALSGATQIGFSDPSFLATNVKAAIVEVLAVAQSAQAGTILPGTISKAMLTVGLAAELDGKALYKGVQTATWNTATTTFTVTDAFVTANTQITVAPTSAKQGNWTVDSAAGSFTITSDATESVPVTFEWSGVK